MVPVKLRLSNFLSYGAQVPELEFDQFHVACLSGGNGQGKSALLDALTWALWGQARKSSESRKPDDELLRMGQSQMQVELVFDLEGERYRVVRSYHKSATGATNRPGLELQVFAPERGDYKPLTGASVKETQKVLEALLGIDYDTFINASFLLQGRSDEFTRKKPSERKEILGRILNLSRYEVLAEQARKKEREAEDRVKQAAAEVDRLNAALEGEPRWKEEHAAVCAALAEGHERLDLLRTEEARLRDQLGAMDARAREADTLRQSLARLDQRQQQDARLVQDLQARIARADDILARRTVIEADYARSEQLRQEQDALVEKQHLHLALEQQLVRKQQELHSRRTGAEQKRHALEVDLAAARQQVNEIAAELGQIPDAERRLVEARNARDEVQALKTVGERKAALRQQCDTLQQALNTQREALRTRAEMLAAQVREAAAAVQASAGLGNEQQALLAASRQREALLEQEQTMRDAGQALKQERQQRHGQIEAWQEEHTRLEQQRDTLLASSDGRCPTCGTPLTDDHQHDVAQYFAERFAALDARLAAATAEVARMDAELATQRQTYQEVRERLIGLQTVPDQLTRIATQLQQAQAQRQTLEGLRQQHTLVEAQLRGETFALAERERLAQVQQEHDALAFDEHGFQQRQQQAALVEPLERERNRLHERAGRKEELERHIQAKTRERDDLLQQLDNGTLLGPLQAEIDALRQQQAHVGFDGGRLEAVRSTLRVLGDATARYRDLLNAQDNRAAWLQQQAEVEAHLVHLTAEQEALRHEVAEIEAELAGRPAVQAQHQGVVADRVALEAQQAAYQARRGELTARLEQAERDRTALDEQGQRCLQAEADSRLYKHLRTAFGKNGIPSLIIEQTLPEVEERANELLDRLTEGRMHVRLQTLRELNAGGTAETLKITITDEHGQARAYETFSGGEAFRVNFALRIALSQLLAERSGVRIRTLVIDEGFGTQDAQGVDSMIGAIQTVQHDFDKILVITHLDQLKEAFPVRIEVEKHPLEGSRFQVIGV
jgi:exonuclease SbcC